MRLSVRPLLRHLLAVWLCCVYAPDSAQCQMNRGYGARASQDLIVLVDVLVNNGIDTPDFAPGAGIVVGTRQDTLVLLTAFHLLRPPHSTVDSISVQLYPNGPALPALQAERDTGLDLAVLKVPLTGGLDSIYPQGLPRPLSPAHVGHHRRTGTSLLASGCPRGQCWGQPEDARVYIVGDSLIEFRASGIENGFSGGALLDTYGAIVGMITHDDPPHTSALRWDVALSKLSAWGYEQNLPLRAAERVGEIRQSILLQGFPLPARQQDGDLLLPAVRMEVAAQVTRRIDVYAGLATASFSLAAEPDTLVAMAGNFGLFGARANFMANRSTFGGRYPDVVHVGMSYRRNVSSQMMYMAAIPDSFDLTTGEQAREPRIKDTVVDGLGITGGLRLYQHGGRALEVQLSADLYRSIDFPITMHFYVSVGISVHSFNVNDPSDP